MKITLNINGHEISKEILPSMTLLDFLRSEGYFGAKFGGCKKGECGACTVLLDGKPVNSCSLLAAQAEGHAINTDSERHDGFWCNSMRLLHSSDGFKC
jgi:aerobic-type carbon monoxide dehydrogenase small subunit (CoxS/CutS family)